MERIYHNSTCFNKSGISYIHELTSLFLLAKLNIYDILMFIEIVNSMTRIKGDFSKPKL